MLTTRAVLELPPWVEADFAARLQTVGASDEARMRLAIELARRNVAESTGGPFGAIVVDELTGESISAGVNLVVPSRMSLSHAEAIAIALAQRQMRSHDLADDRRRKFTLYASGQPCIMCFGILWWSGVTKLVCGARAEDIESIAHFREGPLPADWQHLLREREGLPAIEVVTDVLRSEACAVLQAYADENHPIYNPGAQRES